MFKNKFALKLTKYFALAIVAFAVIISIFFGFLFRAQIVDQNRKQTFNRAVTIATSIEQLSQNSFTSNLQGQLSGQEIFYGQSWQNILSSMQLIEELDHTNIWVFDRNLNFITTGGISAESGQIEFANLPPKTEELVEKVLSNFASSSEDFSSFFAEATITIGIPIKDMAGGIIGGVLVHSPVSGMNQSLLNGLKIFGMSLAVGLILVFLLAISLSKKFTEPILVKEAQDALQQEVSRKEFIANISHELKTPVTVLKGSLESLTDKVVTDPQMVDQYHQQMLQETKFLERLVQDLLDLARLQNAAFSIEKERVFLPEIVQDVTRSLDCIAQQKNQVLDIQWLSPEDEVSTPTLSFLGDYGRLRQMFFIIIDNALKFSPSDSTITIEILSSSIIVRDQGPGITEEELDTIFDRFHKSRSEINKSGTGLGLAIAKEIALRHRMEIKAYNNPLQGASFQISWPYP